MGGAGLGAGRGQYAGWQEGVRRLRRAMDEGHDYAFETTLGAQTIPRLLLDACAQHRVAVWFCGLSSVELHLQRVAGGRR